MPTSDLRKRAVVLAAVALGSLGILGAILLPTSATPGAVLSGSPRGEGVHDTEFRVAGDGSLPETAPRLRAPNEPLGSAERGYAIGLARDAMPTDAQDVLGEPGGEVLAADLPPLAERTAARLVSVAVYDYTADRLHQLLVDLTGRSVLSDQSAEGLQPPPTAAEATVALDLAMKADPAPVFTHEYSKSTGNPLLTPGQVHAVAGVWRPAGLSASSAQATSVCGQHRCVQLLIALPTGQYLDTQDFAVDLSKRSVLRTQ